MVALVTSHFQTSGRAPSLLFLFLLVSGIDSQFIDGR